MREETSIEQVEPGSGALPEAEPGEAAGDRRGRALRHSLMMMGGGLGAFACTFVRGLFTPYILDPVEYGTLAILTLVVLYASYLQLGMKHVQSLLVPSALRRGAHDEVKDITDTVFTVENLLSVLVVIGLWGVYLSGVRFDGSLTLYLTAVLSGIVLLSRFDLLLITYLKGRGAFGLLAQNQFYTALLQLVLGVPLLWFYGVPGLLTSMLFPNLIVDGYIVWRERIRFQPRLVWDKIRRYTQIGFPIYLNVFISKYLWTLEKTLIAVLLSKTELGIYSFALLVFGPISIIPTSFNEVIKRRMAEHRGENGVERPAEMLHYFGFPLASYAALSAIIAGVGYFAYEPSISVLRLLILGFPFFQTRLFTSYTLNVVDRRWLYVALQLAALLGNAVLDYALIRAGYGIQGAAVGSSISYIFFALIMLYATCRVVEPEQGERYAIGRFARVALAWALPYGMIFGLDAAWGWAAPPAEGLSAVALDAAAALGKSALYTLAVLLTFAAAFRVDGFAGKMRGVLADVLVLVRARLRAAVGARPG